jgi:hypothetical protein
MWAKNCLFAALAFAGIALLAGSVQSIRPAQRRPEARFGDDSILSAAARIDAVLALAWRDAGLQPAARANDLLIARRLSLALVGSIPSLEDIRHLESLPDDHCLDIWLAELLADRRSAEYLAERFARVLVGVENVPFLLYRRRRFVNWLADEIADNRPYSQIATKLIADDGLWTDHPAVNFVTVTINPDDENKPDPNRLAARIARGLLGVRLDCAECHDHPFADWKEADFQGLAAFFAGTKQTLRGIRDDPASFATENLETGESSRALPVVPYAPHLLPNEGDPRARLAAWLTHTDNRAFARATVNRAWAILFGRPLVEPIDDLPVSGEFPAAIEILADDFISSGFDLRRLLAVIASTKAFGLDSRLPSTVSEERYPKHEAQWAVFPITRLRPEQVVGALLQSRSLATVDYESNILIRAGRTIGQIEFIERYGDAGPDEFDARGGTTAQRLLMMNGQLIGDLTKDNLLMNAPAQIAALSTGDATAVETCLLAVLTRGPTVEEAQYFAQQLRDTRGNQRRERLGDIYWALLNTTEFSWNH